MDDDPTKLLADLIATGIDPALIVRVSNLIAKATELDRRRAQGAARQRRWQSKMTSSDVTDVISRHPPMVSSPTPLSSFHPQSSKPKVSRTGARSRLPAEWQPDNDAWLYAKNKGFDDRRILAEAEKFKDHAKATGRLQADWQAAWRNWINSPYQINVNGKNYGNSAIKDAFAELRFDLERSSAGEPGDPPMRDVTPGRTGGG